MAERLGGSTVPTVLDLTVLDLTDGAVGARTAGTSVDLGSVTDDLTVPRATAVASRTAAGSPSGGNQTGDAADNRCPGRYSPPAGAPHPPATLGTRPASRVPGAAGRFLASRPAASTGL